MGIWKRAIWWQSPSFLQKERVVLAHRKDSPQVNNMGGVVGDTAGALGQPRAQGTHVGRLPLPVGSPVWSGHSCLLCIIAHPLESLLLVHHPLSLAIFAFVFVIMFSLHFLMSSHAHCQAFKSFLLATWINNLVFWCLPTVTNKFQK